jgi:hypothetical protein
MSAWLSSDRFSSLSWPVSNSSCLSASLPALLQILEFPWPITARDILLQRIFSFDRQARKVAVNYRSVLDSRIPPSKGLIRAESPSSLWQFRALTPQGDGKGGDGAAEAGRKALRWLQGSAKAKEQRGGGEGASSPASSYPTAAGPPGGGFAAMRHSPDGRPRTVVEIESLVDSKGSIPAWFINFMQK